jgi:hypothetical protein
VRHALVNPVIPSGARGVCVDHHLLLSVKSKGSANNAALFTSPSS